MSNSDSPNVASGSDDLFPMRRAFAGVGILVAFAVMFAFAPPADPASVVNGLPCSVLSENNISAVLGTTMRLLPSTGTVCEYASASEVSGARLFVVAHRAPGTARYTYTFAVVPRDGDRRAGVAERQQLARLAHRQPAHVTLSLSKGAPPSLP
jgi:hypothetical protein